MNSAIVSSLGDLGGSIIQTLSEHTFQVSRWLVQASDGERSEQMLVCSADGIADSLSEKVVADLNSETPGHISAVIEDARGLARVRSKKESTQNAFHIAASVAVMKASWGWDESQPIVVRVDDDGFEIYPSFDGGAWIAKDRP